MSERYEAHHEHRTFYFYIVSKEPEELKITIYNTPYTLYDRSRPASPSHPSAVMQDAKRQVAAGYFLYGAATAITL